MGPYMLREKRGLGKEDGGGASGRQQNGEQPATRVTGAGEERLLRTLCRCWARKTGKELARPIF